MKKKILAMALTAICATQAWGQLAECDANRPWGWCNSTSLTEGDTYTVTGGGESTTTNTITLTSTGSDMKSTIESAIKKYPVVILDGSAGDFIISSQMSFQTSDRTVVGINGARLCTEFYLTDEMHDAFDAAGVKSKSTSSDTGGTLSNGTSVDEARELATRQILIDLTGDSKEAYRKAGIFNIKNCSNVIIRNIAFVGPGPCDLGGYDLITAQATTHLWVDHCSFTDGLDGNFDITNQCDMVSVTWCRFAYTDRAYDHANTNLIGSSDSSTSDSGKLNTTFAFCEWAEGCNQRMPMVRYGTIHIVNCYYNCPGNSLAINGRKNSSLLMESCYFAKNVSTYKMQSTKSYVFSDCYSASGKSFESSGATTVPYSTPHKIDVMDVPAVLTASNGVGPTLTNPLDISGESEGSPITNVWADGQTVTEERYNLSGARVGGSRKGLQVIVRRSSSGKVHAQKVLVR